MKGIIFSGDHPPKVLDGTETMARRVINPQPYEYKGAWVWAFRKGQLATQGYWLDHCPYGGVGDLMWMRETHYRWGHWAKNGISKTGRQKWTFKAVSNTTGGLRFPDNHPPFGETDRTQMGWHKRPSIFMPRWASRADLEITGLRAERLQEITVEDALAEGMIPAVEFANEPFPYNCKGIITGFSQLWDSLNAKRYSWESNPWVWVIEFKLKEVTK